MLIKVSNLNDTYSKDNREITAKCRRVGWLGRERERDGWKRRRIVEKEDASSLGNGLSTSWFLAFSETSCFEVSLSGL